MVNPVPDPPGPDGTDARTTLLADVAAAVAELSPAASLAGLAQALVPGLLPWCAVVVVDGDVLRVAATAGLGGPAAAGAWPLPPAAAGRDGSDDAGERSVDDALVAQLLGEGAGPVELRGEDLVPGGPPATGSPGEGARLSRWLAEQVGGGSGPGSGPRGGSGRGSGPALTLPLPGRAQVLGLLVAGVTGPGGPDAQERALLRHCTRLAGRSLDNALAHARQRGVVEVLQRSARPEQASVPGLDVWSYCLPGEDPEQVGGAWFDVVLPDPGPGGEGVGLAVGDVVGEDAEAVAAAGRLRSVVHSAAREHDEPGTVLMRVDQLVRGTRVPRSASIVYAHLTELGDGYWEMAWSRAGQVPPVLVRAGRARLLREADGTPLGTGDRPRETAAEELGPGDVVVLSTGGLLERRARALERGVQALLAAGHDVGSTDAAGVGEHLLAALGDVPDVDSAVVVVRVPTAARDRQDAGPRRRRWQLPGEPGSVARARRLLETSARRWGLVDVRSAELVVSELVAGAVMHGWGPVGLRLQHDERGLLLEVEDSDPAPPDELAPGAGAGGGYGLHVLARLSDWGWRPHGSGKVVWALLPDRSR